MITTCMSLYKVCKCVSLYMMCTDVFSILHVLLYRRTDVLSHMMVANCVLLLFVHTKLMKLLVHTYASLQLINLQAQK